MRSLHRVKAIQNIYNYKIQHSLKLKKLKKTFNKINSMNNDDPFLIYKSHIICNDEFQLAKKTKIMIF